MMTFSGQKICILGAGREGQATVRFFRERFPDAVLSLADQKNPGVDFVGIETLFESDYPKDLSRWDIVVVSPGIPPHTELLGTARVITTATNIFFEECPAKIIAVTGSKGKSTTSSLIADILRMGGKNVHLVGNIGKPALDYLQAGISPEDIVVFELSSYQASRLTKGPDIGVITNLFPEHLDYHGSLEQYYTDKLKMATMQKISQVLIYNGENLQLIERVKEMPAKLVAYPDVSGAHVRDGKVYFGNEAVCLVADIPLKGEHNVMNVLAAVTVAFQTVYPFEISKVACGSAIRNFQSLPHRLQLVGKFKDIEFYDDSISTTPESTLAALQALPNVGCIFLGGTNRGYEFGELAKKLQVMNIPAVVLFPDTGELIKKEFEVIGYQPVVLKTRDMQEAVRFAYATTPKNMVCLLSCASPSFSVFKNFEERGDKFQEAVRAMGK